MVKNTTYSKKSLRMWNIRTLVFLIGILFLTIQIAFLALNIFLYVEDSKAHVGTFLDWFVNHGVRIPLCDDEVLPSPIVKSSVNQETTETLLPQDEDTDPSSSLPTSAISSDIENTRACIIRVS